MEINKFIVPAAVTIKEAMKKLDKAGRGFLAVYEKDKIFGIVTDGDIRRSIINGVKLTDKISRIANRDFISVNENASPKEIEDIFKSKKLRHVPVLKGGKLADIIFEDDFFLGPRSIRPKRQKTLTLPVVIMAGGRGRRLNPFSQILPKALLPVNEKPIIEIIMDEFAQYGINRFYISVYDKAKMIKSYFHDHDGGYDISYLEEAKPMGTIAALKFLQGKLKGPFFISNCDTVIRDDLTEIYEFHRKGKFSLTLVASMKHAVIPYGICEMEKGGALKKITEKPEHDFLINTGLYLANPDILEYIPRNKRFDITDLISALKKDKKRIGLYPIREKSWHDLGQWEGYDRAAKCL